MKKMSKHWSALSLLILSTVLLTACGGGGGGGGGGSDQITYDGVRTQATIDDENAAELAELAYTGSELGEQSMVFSAVETSSGQPAAASTPLIPKLTNIFLGLPDRLASGIDNPLYARTVTSISESSGCTGGGNVSISGSWDDVAGTLNATINFNSCTENGETMTGPIDISASGLDSDAYGDPVFNNVEISVSFKNMSYSSADENLTISGGATMSINSDSVRMSMTMEMRDNRTGLLAKVENYTMNVVDMVNHSEIGISGKVYRSDIGYVELSTTTAIRVDIYGEPYEGVFRIDGANGTWAEVDFSLQVPQGTWGDATGTLGTFSI